MKGSDVSVCRSETNGNRAQNEVCKKVLLVTDHSALTWAKTYENANRRLAAWGLVFVAFPELVIIHRPGRVHSNVDPLSRLPRIPEFVSPARGDLPSQTLSTEHGELQQLWHDFIKKQELAIDSYPVTTRTLRKRSPSKRLQECCQKILDPN